MDQMDQNPVKVEMLQVIEEHVSGINENAKVLDEGQMNLVHEESCLAYSWTIDNIAEHINNAVYKTSVRTGRHQAFGNKKNPYQYTCDSNVFPIQGHNFGGKASLGVQSGDIMLSISYVDSDITQLQHPNIVPQATFIVRDRSENEDKMDIVRPVGCLYCCPLLPLGERDNGMAFIYKCDTVLDPIYTVDGSTVIDILVETPSMTMSSQSYDGELTWRLDSYAAKKAAEEKGLATYHLSPYFYTSATGYRAQAEMKLNVSSGLQKTKHVFVSVKFLTGQFDSSLPKEFKHTTTVTIQHPSDATKHLVKSVTRDSPRESATFYLHNYIDMGPRSRIETEGFVVDDTLMCQVTIQSCD